MDRYDPEYINEEEIIMESIKEIDPHKIAIPTEDEQKKMKAAAKKFMKNNTKMNIRIDPFELEKIKEQAELAGLKYQTFIKSVLHKYITGQLIEKDKTTG